LHAGRRASRLRRRGRSGWAARIGSPHPEEALCPYTYTIRSKWFGSLGELTPDGLRWLAEHLRALGYDAVLRCRRGVPHDIVLPKPVAAEDFWTLIEDGFDAGVIGHRR